MEGGFVFDPTSITSTSSSSDAATNVFAAFQFAAPDNTDNNTVTSHLPDAVDDTTRTVETFFSLSNNLDNTYAAGSNSAPTSFFFVDPSLEQHMPEQHMHLMTHNINVEALTFEGAKSKIPLATKTETSAASNVVAKNGLVSTTAKTSTRRHVKPSRTAKTSLITQHPDINTNLSLAAGLDGAPPDVREKEWERFLEKARPWLEEDDWESVRSFQFAMGARRKLDVVWPDDEGRKIPAAFSEMDEDKLWQALANRARDRGKLGDFLVKHVFHTANVHLYKLCSGTQGLWGFLKDHMAQIYERFDSYPGQFIEAVFTFNDSNSDFCDYLDSLPPGVVTVEQIQRLPTFSSTQDWFSLAKRFAVMESPACWNLAVRCNNINAELIKTMEARGELKNIVFCCRNASVVRTVLEAGISPNWCDSSDVQKQYPWLYYISTLSHCILLVEAGADLSVLKRSPMIHPLLLWHLARKSGLASLREFEEDMNVLLWRSAFCCAGTAARFALEFDIPFSVDVLKPPNGAAMITSVHVASNIGQLFALGVLKTFPEKLPNDLSILDIQPYMSWTPKSHKWLDQKRQQIALYIELVLRSFSVPRDLRRIIISSAMARFWFEDCLSKVPWGTKKLYLKNFGEKYGVFWPVSYSENSLF